MTGSQGSGWNQSPQTPTASSTLTRELSSPMHKRVTSANLAVSKDHKQVDPSAADYDHQAFATN
jgi:hypothetical protein